MVPSAPREYSQDQKDYGKSFMAEGQNERRIGKGMKL